MSATNSASDIQDGEFPWHLGIFDAHCHPTDTMANVDDIPSMKARVLTIMATRLQDQDLVGDVNQKIGLPVERPSFEGDCESALCQVLPSFGWHPWFSHQLYDDTKHSAKSPSKLKHYREVVTPSPEDERFIAALPKPRPLSEYVEQTRRALRNFPLALVGEIGIDRSFRIPEFTDSPKLTEVEPDLTPGGREGRRLSPYRVDIQHQKTVLKAQLRLAGEMCRAVSVHGVAAHGIVYDALRETWQGYERRVPSQRERKRRTSVDAAHAMEVDGKEASGRTGPKPYPSRICLHSYSGPLATVKRYIHPTVPAIVFFSFSQVINFSTSAGAKAIEVIKALPEDRILVESDLHCAGPRMDQLLEDVVRLICRERDWSLEQGVKQLAANWKHFALGWT